MIVTDELIILGEQIKKLRTDRGYTIRTLAAVTRIDKMQIVKIEAGRVDVRFTTLCRLALALNVTQHELIPITANPLVSIDKAREE